MFVARPCTYSKTALTNFKVFFTKNGQRFVQCGSIYKCITTFHYAPTN